MSMLGSFIDAEEELQDRSAALMARWPTNEGPRLRVAVVGGGIGHLHITAYKILAATFDLVAICDIDEAKAQELADEYGIPNVVTDFAALCQMELDVIDICTPPHLHRQQIAEALRHGKHVICEKPLVASLRDIDELAQISAETERQVMPIFQYRFGHGLQKLKHLVDEQVTGPAYVATVETHWRRGADYYAVPWRGKWQTELGGVLVTHAVHAHDMLGYILGPIQSVFARTATRLHDIEVEDCASISLQMADGSLASLSATVGSAKEITRHRFCFGNLSAESHTAPYANPSDPWQFDGDSPDHDAAIAATLANFTPLPEGYVGQFYRFHQALQHGHPPPVTLADARASLELLTAIYTSVETGAAVSLPIESSHPKYGGWIPESESAKSLSEKRL